LLSFLFSSPLLNVCVCVCVCVSVFATAIGGIRWQCSLFKSSCKCSSWFLLRHWLCWIRIRHIRW
jgi:hypothetical protein